MTIGGGGTYLELMNQEQAIFEDDGRFPNNGRLPLLLYREAIPGVRQDGAAAVEEVFHAGGWGGSWRNGVYAYHHYHSTAHEVLGVYRGSAAIQLGGEGGAVFEVAAGDVVIIPAGVAHKRLRASDDFRVVGAYPAGQSPDMNTGEPGERPRADRNIAAVAHPGSDPVRGPDGPLMELWPR